ncbi:hypothetical protein ACRYCC_28305 [Actinomadura scrupuli]|uniref:hypothetical protein n=1 Tax=Actinomadura scrupuli TaxID=559629 RepID=UPI003D98A099
MVEHVGQADAGVVDDTDHPVPAEHGLGGLGQHTGHPRQPHPPHHHDLDAGIGESLIEDPPRR